MTVWCMCTACWVTKATQSLTTFNTYCFSTVTMVERTHLNATLHID